MHVGRIVQSALPLLRKMEAYMGVGGGDSGLATCR